MSRRLFVVVAIVAVLVGLIAVDRIFKPKRALLHEVPAADLQPIAAAPNARSGSWFCPGGSTDRIDQGDTSVVLANNTGASAAVQVTALPSTGTNKNPVTKAVRLDPTSSVTVRLADMLGGAVPAGALVVGAPGVVAQQLLKAPEGLVASTCASETSDHWYTAAGSTAAGTTQFLSLLNPFPGDAIADLAFSTEQGRTIPVDLQGVLIPGRSLVVIDVGDKVRRRDEVASEVVLRKGRLAVGRSYRKSNASSVTIAAPSADTTWSFGGGVKADGVANRLVVANPSETDAQITAELRLQEGAAQPLTLAVPAKTRAVLNLDDAVVQKGVPYGLVVRSAEDVPVVVERSIETKTGRSDVLGSRLAYREWVSAGAGSRGADNLAFLNTGDSEATITVIMLDGSGRAIATPAPLHIAPGGRGSLKIPDDAKGKALRISADQPIITERDAGDGTATVGGSIAVPLGRA